MDTRGRHGLAHFAVVHQMGLTVAGVLLAGVGFSATVGAFLLWSESTSAADAVTLGMKVAAGIGVTFGAVIALGRFELAREAEVRARDSEARLQRQFEFELTRDYAQRSSELYMSAIDQLGSDTSVKRIAGLYSLDRLARHSPEFRQIVMSMWCGYLRTPTLSVVNDEIPDEDRHEVEVRRLAQALILGHRMCEPWNQDGGETSYWDEPLEIDLSGAVLIDWGDNNMRWQEHVSFRGARFHGRAFLDGDFEHGVSFDSATFLSDVAFQGQFRQRSGFRDTRFNGESNFQHAHFSFTEFTNARFHGTAWFAGGCTFFGRDFPPSHEHTFDGALYFSDLHWSDFEDRRGAVDGSAFPPSPE